MSQGDSSYFMNADAMIESARLINQDRLVTATVSLLPSGIDGKSLHHVLDIGCGPGVWLLDLVAQYPGVQGVGIDISQSMIDIAQLLQKLRASSLPFFKWMRERRSRFLIICLTSCRCV